METHRSRPIDCGDDTPYEKYRQLPFNGIFWNAGIMYEKFNNKKCYGFSHGAPEDIAKLLELHPDIVTYAPTEPVSQPEENPMVQRYKQVLDDGQNFIVHGREGEFQKINDSICRRIDCAEDESMERNPESVCTGWVEPIDESNLMEDGMTDDESHADDDDIPVLAILPIDSGMKEAIHTSRFRIWNGMEDVESTSNNTRYDFLMSRNPPRN